MIQSIYSSVNNADSVSCGKKGTVIKSDPIPLLRDKFLGEYRTELEKAKVRKNLGIPDKNVLEWGNIEGFVEKQTDLVEYVESKWNYTTELNENVKNIKQAMDYALDYVTNFKGEHDAVVELQNSVNEINIHLDTLDKTTNKHTEDIASINKLIVTVNEAIQKLNEDLLSINVDANILAWIESRLENSDTVVLEEDTLKVIISTQENNAIQKSEGLFVKDLSSEVQTNTESISNLQQKLEENTQELEILGTYTTDLSDETTVPTQVGGIKVGTTAESLKGKTINQIIDTILFPTTVRDLIYPSVYYTSITDLVEVGTVINRPELIFSKGDAGEEINRTDELTFESQIVDTTTYAKLGTYTYTGSVTYEAGEYLIDNKGNTTTQRVEAGTKTTSATVTTTYPWYVGDIKQNLVRFETQSGIQSFSVTGKAIIKLPGSNSEITSFKVDGGLGYLDIDLNGWSESTEQLNGITYKVWTKNDSYPAVLPHQINFKLKL